jgi:dTDP-glucose 4,6-dehydratase/UDP-glucuronate decarboxylase
MGGKKMLVTGGAGFLGFYLVQAIEHWNRHQGMGNPIDLTVLDNFIRGMPPWLEKIKTEARVKLITHDISLAPPQSLMDEFSYIIHAASIASPTYYRKYPIETMDANVYGLRYLLEIHKQQKLEDTVLPEGFLFFSSSEVYGDPTMDQIPTTESYNGNVSFTGPRACYDESKRYGETLCVNFARQFQLPIKIVRPFNNYGPGLKISDRRVIPDFAKNILDGKDIVLLSDGSPTRTFCYVADAVVGYIKVLVRGKDGQAYNIGAETPEISMVDLAEKMAKIAKEQLHYKGSVVFQKSKQENYLIDNPNRRCPSIKKAMLDLDYHPEVDIEDGLRRTLVWYNDNSTAEDA